MPVRSFEPLNTRTDITRTRTFMHEVIPITGSIVSGTYSDNNIKNYTHGQFQSVYDYPYLSSSANHIFDLTLGYDESSPLSSSTATQNAKKINMYNQFTQVLLGYTGSSETVRLFENDLKLDGTGSMKEVFIMTFSRLLVKDQIKKGTFKLQIASGSWADGANPGSGGKFKILQDVSASVDGTKVGNCIGGDFGILYDTNVQDGVGLGVLYYQAGIAVLTASLFSGVANSNFNSGSYISSSVKYDSLDVNESLVSASISGSVDALRHRIYDLQFNNTTEINSTIYFCRAPHNKFNYSANPTYTSGSKIRVKQISADTPLSYITTVGLYNSANELLAVAKLSEPLRKDPSNELTLRVRLDY